MERDLMWKAKRPAIVQRLENGRRTDANRAVVSPLPRLAIATEKAKKIGSTFTRVDLLGPRAWNIYLTC